MIQAGFAHQYDRPYRYQEHFKEAKRVAADAGIGLWSRGTYGGDTTQAAGGGRSSAPEHRACEKL